MPWVLLVFQKSLIMKRYIGKVLKKQIKYFGWNINYVNFAFKC